MCLDSKSENSENSIEDDSEISENNTDYRPLRSPKKEKKSAVKRILAQTLVTGAVMLSSASCGMPVGYSAILLPQLKYPNESLQIDDDIGSWIASVHSAATPLGSLLSGIIMDRCGRKLALQIASLPLVLGWLLIGFSNSHGILLAGRLIAGISAGLTAAAGQVLIGEISEPHLRGIFSSVPLASYSFGILLVYALGSLLHWRFVAELSTILPILSILVFFFLPESPVWLVRHGKLEAAKRALIWLRGGDIEQAIDEKEHLKKRVKEEQLHQDNNTSTLQTLFRKEVLKPFAIINVFNILQILSGTYLIVFYAVDILSHIKDKDIDHFMAAVLTAGVRFIFSIIASVLLGVIGRRTLALTSGIGTTLSALLLGFFLHQSCSTNAYISAMFVLFYVATNTVGFLILPGVLLSELFPAKIRGLAGGLTFMTFNLLLFAIAKVFPFIKTVVGVSGVFFLFGASSLLASIFLYIMMPETKGKTLSQIEDYFKQNNITWVKRDKRWEKKLQEIESERLA